MANRFLGAKVTKKVKFMDLDLDIHKLTVSQVMLIQQYAKENEENPTEEGNIKLLNTVVRQGADELKDLSDDELKEFPLDELSRVSNEIMKYSGLNKAEK